jgi:hypothetical protein
MSYGTVFWGNSTDSTKIFKLQKKVVRIMTNIRNRDSCRVVIKELKILPFYSQYIYSLLTSVLNNSKLFITNSMVSNINTRQGSNFYLPLPRLTVYQKGVHYFGPKVFNSLPSHTKDSLFTNKHKFRLIVKDFLQTNTYYSLEKFFNSDST